LEKKKIVKDYEKLPPEVIEKVKEAYPSGYSGNLISYTNIDGLRVSALPFETEEFYYLIRMTVSEAKKFDEADDDLFPDYNSVADVSIDDIDEDQLPVSQDDSDED